MELYESIQMNRFRQFTNEATRCSDSK